MLSLFMAAPHTAATKAFGEEYVAWDDDELNDDDPDDPLSDDGVGSKSPDYEPSLPTQAAPQFPSSQ
jgi:hypothetical protein